MFAVFRPLQMNYYGGFSRGGAKTEKTGIKSHERKRIIVATSAKIRDEEKCIAAMENIVKNAHSKSGTKSHFWCKGNDGKSLMILEQYEDEKALIELAITDEYADSDFTVSTRITDVMIYRAVSEQTKELFAAHRPKLMNYFGGYSK